MPRLSSIFAVMGALLLVSGCGSAGFYPVKGQFVDPSGAPVTVLEGFEVTLEGTGAEKKDYSSTGVIDSQGRFTLYTNSPGDGVPLGDCKVLIQPKMKDSEREASYPLNPRYRTFEKSGLTAKVEAKANEFKFTVELRKGN